MSSLSSATKIYPPPAEDLRVEDIYKEIFIPFQHPSDSELPYIALNMVSSLDGKTSVNGTAGSIGGPADRRVMRNIRSRFDAVLRGAGTLRAEKISLGVTDDLARHRLSEGRDAHPLDLILSTDSTKLPLDNLLDTRAGRVAILVPSGSAPTSRDDLRTLPMPTTPDGSLDLLRCMRILKREHGVRNLLLEGGPTLNSSFLSLDIISELFLTIAPKLLGEFSDPMPSTLLAPDGRTTMIREKPLRLTSTHVWGDEMFLRYAFSQNIDPASTKVNFR